MITQQIKLNLIPGQVFPRVNASQYDSGTRTLQMALYNGDQVFNIASGMTAVVQGTKPDKTGFQYAATITEGSNIATLDITQQMTAVKGNVICELVISNGNNRIATVNFILYVEAAALAGDTVISETDLPLIEEAAELAERIDGIVQQVDEDAQTASNAATAAQRASEAATTAKDAAEESADKAEAYGTHPPYIGANGNWFVYNVTTQQYEDSGVKAQGPLSGLTDVEISNPAENDIIAYDATAQKWKNSSEFETLTNNVDVLIKNGAVNVIPFNLSEVKSKNTSGTWNNNAYTLNGITFTFNDDGSLVVDGTASARTTLKTFEAVADKWLEKGVTYIARTYNAIFEDTTQDCFVQLFRSGSPYPVINKFDNTEFVVDNIYFGTSYTLCVQVVVESGKALTNQTIKPLIARASYNGIYVPYAMTNRELTEDGPAIKKLSLADYITLETGISIYASQMRKIGSGYEIEATLQGPIVVGKNKIGTMSPIISEKRNMLVFGSGRILDSSSVYHPITVSLHNGTGELSVYSETPNNLTIGYITFSLFIPS